MSECRVSAYRCPCRGGLNRTSRPIWKLETRTAQGPGVENRVTHSTLNGRVIWPGEDPQKSAILGPRRDSRPAQKALHGVIAPRDWFLERAYINNLDSRPMALLSTRGRV